MLSSLKLWSLVIFVAGLCLYHDVGVILMGQKKFFFFNILSSCLLSPYIELNWIKILWKITHEMLLCVLCLIDFTREGKGWVYFFFSLSFGVRGFDLLIPYLGIQWIGALCAFPFVEVVVPHLAFGNSLQVALLWLFRKSSA